jgi:hypothetical protein
MIDLATALGVPVSYLTPIKQLWTLISEKTAGAKALDMIAMNHDYGFSYTHLAQLNQRQIDTLRMKCEARSRQAAAPPAADTAMDVAKAVAESTASLAAAQGDNTPTTPSPVPRVKNAKK